MHTLVKVAAFLRIFTFLHEIKSCARDELEDVESVIVMSCKKRALPVTPCSPTAETLHTAVCHDEALSFTYCRYNSRCPTTEPGLEDAILLLWLAFLFFSVGMTHRPVTRVVR